MAFTDHIVCVPYITEEELLTCCKVAAEHLAEGDPRLGDAIEDASMVVYYLTGRQFGGTCETTVRPCLGSDCLPCGSCKPNAIDLGLWPITEVTSIRVNGETLTGSEITDTYHVDSYRYLVRNDGDTFPFSSNPYAIAGSAEDNEDDGYVFEVTVEHGLEIPRLVARATRALACQLVEYCLDLPCQLPDRVTNIARQGVSMDIKSAEDIVRDGTTGIYEVDLAIKVLNPSRLQSPSFFWSGQQRVGRRVNT